MVFKKGESGNPNGRPKGAKEQIASDFLKDLNDLWKESGMQILKQACASNPMKFVEVVASLLPKEATLNVNETITLQSQSVQALDNWIEGTFRSIKTIDNENTVPN